MQHILPLLLLLSWTLDHSRCSLLRVVTVPIDPYFQPTSAEPEGYLVDLIKDLLERLNNGTNQEVTYRFYRSPDGKFGTPEQRGDWNGMIGEVIKGEADLAAAPLTINKARSQVVHFSHPFMSVSIVPFAKRPQPGTPMPFTGLDDLLAKVQAGNLSIGYIQHGSTENFMGGHKNPAVRSLHDLSKAANTSSPYVDSLAAAIQRIRQDPKFVYFGEHTALFLTMLNQPCDVFPVWSGMIGEGYHGFAFPKTATGRQWVDRFNDVLLAAQQDGTVDTLFRKWWFQKATCPMPKMCECQQTPAH